MRKSKSKVKSQKWQVEINHMGRRLVDFGRGTGGFLVEAHLAGLAADGR